MRMKKWTWKSIRKALDAIPNNCRPRHNQLTELLAHTPKKYATALATAFSVISWSPESSPHPKNTRRPCGLCELFVWNSCRDCPLERKTGVVCFASDSLFSHAYYDHDEAAALQLYATLMDIYREEYEKI